MKWKNIPAKEKNDYNKNVHYIIQTEQYNTEYDTLIRGTYASLMGVKYY